MDEVEKESFGRCTNCDYPFYHNCLPVHDAIKTEDGGLILTDHYLCMVCSNKFLNDQEVKLKAVHQRILSKEQADEFNKQIRKEWLDDDQDNENPPDGADKET